MRILCVAVALLLVSAPSIALNDSMLSRLEGYTLIKVGEITGWRDSNGKKGDAFEGCDYGRVLTVDYSLQVTCAGYGYSYSYHPKAFFFRRGSNIKMIVESDIYDVTSP
jgi:hypothetical protein